METQTTLAVGDVHVNAEDDLSRTEILGKLILDLKPDNIVLMGDFLTLSCLSSFDKDKRKLLENKRYLKEIDAGNIALNKITGAFGLYNRIRKIQKKAQYLPNIYYLEGNHEYRLTRYFEVHPVFDGRVGIRNDLFLDKRGITWVPYKEYLYLHGVGFTHIPFNKSRAIGGIFVTRKAQALCVDSIVFAHTHEQELSNIRRFGQKDLQQVYCCGCFFDKEEPYASGNAENFWKGVTLLTHYAPGRFDITTFAMDHLRKRYLVEV